MPTYEYACSKCGHRFEQFQSMRDDPLRKCPKCHKAALKRLIGRGAGLIFKGSGFYITDYKNKGMAKDAASEAAPAAPPKPAGEAAPAAASKGPGSGPKAAKPAAAPSKK
jgi:putative FmdB family regulatory protein